ncbi:glycine zipper domain-containing protein [Variovorax sp. RHLX14]|uniref:glycine zipper domain-containing protein n=1 Tax=Variovorax sp. RHLX14 TaxID=1259731 RepID=UPI003F46D01A
MSASNNLEAAANAVVEDMANDVKGVLGTMDLAANPQIKALRQRVEAKLAIARELAAEKSKLAAKKAKEAASTANAYAHDEPWQIAAGALAVGVLVGLLIGKRS